MNFVGTVRENNLKKQNDGRLLVLCVRLCGWTSERCICVDFV